ncbi:hypothetical protein KGQ55_02430 [Patescibacteria group bacterium]|nr:hypothetical protein [Patescibacteria group bacterium]
MKYALIAFALAGLLLGSPARANDCNTTLYAKLGSAYQYQVLRVMGSQKSIAESEVTVSCGNWWFDLWGAKDLTGHQRFGNEVDVTAAYDTSIQTELGTFAIEGYASYGIVPDFRRMKDDLIQLYVDVGRPFSLRSATVTPYVRVIQLVGLGVYPNRVVIRSGTRFAMPLTSRLSFSADVATTSDLREDTVTARFVPAVSLDAGDGWAINADAKIADGLKPEFELGFSKKF